MVAAVAAVLLALWFFAARDDATTSGPPAAAAPGVAAAAPAPYAADIGRGNVVLEVRRGDTGPVLALATAIAGPPDHALRAAGQAVIVDHRQADVAEPEITCTDQAGATVACPPRSAIVAYARGRRLDAASAADPRLRAFIEYWLGRAAG